MSKNISHLSGRKGLTDSLFERINQLAEEGTPGKEDLAKLADEFLIGEANTYGTATFYDFLKPENKGKKAYVCSGSVCMTAGTQSAVQGALQKHLKPDEIGHMCCLGRCHENSAFWYDGRNYSAKSEAEIEAILQGNGPDGMDDYHVETHGPAVLTGEPLTINQCRQLLQDALKNGSANTLEEIKTSNVRGRGGAGFPMGLKLEFCRKAEGELKFIVCNADEGDPGAYSDRYLLEKQPLSVALGMMISGYVTGASWGVFYIRAEYPESVEIVNQAVQSLHEAGLLGDNILGSDFSFHFKVVKAAGAYICGEETALLSSLEGQRPEVRVRPPFPAQEGLFRKPTVVNNVETLACVPWILQHGGAKYAAIGRGRSTGTKLVSLDSHFNRPGMYEVEMGTPLKTVVEDLGKGFNKNIKAMHIGGPLGGIVPVHKTNDLTLDFESFQENGFLLGHASIVCVPQDFPMVQYLEHLFEFTSDESCGKCFPCRLGSKRGAEMLHKAQHDNYKIDRELMDDLLETLEIGSLCALGGGLPLGIKNALEYFDDELSQYFRPKESALEATVKEAYNETSLKR